MNKVFNVLALLVGAYATGCSGTVSLTCETNLGKAGHTCFSGMASGGTVESDSCPTDYTRVDSCPTTDELGGCTISVNGSGVTVTTTTFYYSDGGFTAAQAKAACKAPGTWTAR